MTTRNVLCNFCSGSSSEFRRLNNTALYSGIEMAMDTGGLFRVRVLTDNGESFTTQEIIQMRYCPACGRKFRR